MLEDLRCGRHLATFILHDGTNVNEWLVEKEFSEPYFVAKEAE